MSGTDDLRASDADRDRVAEVVRQAASEGRLDFAETEERLDKVFAAKTYGELARLTEDLPNADPALVREGKSVQRGSGTAAGAGLTLPGPSQLSAIFGEEKVKGTWLVPPHMRVRAVCGEVTLDFTEATIPHAVLIDAQVAFGQLNLVVPDDVAVVFEPQTTVLASRTNKSQSLPQPGTPVIRVRGQVVLGELSAKPPPRRWFRR